MEVTGQGPARVEGLPRDVNEPVRPARRDLSRSAKLSPVLGEEFDVGNLIDRMSLEQALERFLTRPVVGPGGPDDGCRRAYGVVNPDVAFLTTAEIQKGAPLRNSQWPFEP